MIGDDLRLLREGGTGGGSGLLTYGWTLTDFQGSVLHGADA